MCISFLSRQRIFVGRLRRVRPGAFLGQADPTQPQHVLLRDQTTTSPCILLHPLSIDTLTPRKSSHIVTGPPGSVDTNSSRKSEQSRPIPHEHIGCVAHLRRLPPSQPRPTLPFQQSDPVAADEDIFVHGKPHHT